MVCAKRSRSTYLPNLGRLLLCTGVWVEGEGGYASFLALLDHLSLGIVGRDAALRIASSFDSSLLLELRRLAFGSHLGSWIVEVAGFSIDALSTVNGDHGSRQERRFRGSAVNHLTHQSLGRAIQPRGTNERGRERGEGMGTEERGGLLVNGRGWDAQVGTSNNLKHLRDE